MTDRFLSTPLRRALERTIKEARAVAEEAASDAIRRLGVADAKAPTYLDQAGQELRRRLRAHGRALGDRKAADDTQATDRLIEATAYEHWHRRLFARFLAERHLLRHPEHDVVVTLEDCKEFAAEERLADEWAAAEVYASKMLPAVFRPEDPVLELEFSPEHELKLRQLVLGIDAETFQTDDALGWTYQFWRALEKDRINKAGGKIGAAELPAVTQLFTEPYMVRFLLHNTLGAWWAEKVLAERPELVLEAPDEATLRAAVRLPGYDFDMLRFVREGEDAPRWRPAAGSFERWPSEARALTVLDPCCGSGHFLTEALTILSALRAVEEALSPAESSAVVLRDNLYGLELDGRCVQIAAFAVALAAWKMGGFQTLPTPHVAWVGAPPPLARPEFEALGNGDPEIRRGLGMLHDLFAQAPLLGSLLDPDRGDLGDAHGALDFEPMLDALITKAKHAQKIDVDLEEGVIAARGMADAAALLRKRFSLIVTNPPFLTRQSMEPALRDHLDIREKIASADLAVAMLHRALRLVSQNGTVSLVLPTNALYQPAYRKLRHQLLGDHRLVSVARLGAGAFQEVTGEVVKVSLVTLNARQQPANFVSIDAAEREGRHKADALVASPINKHEIATILESGDARIVIDALSPGIPLAQAFKSRTGTRTGDNARVLRALWEVSQLGSTYRLMQTVPDATELFGGRHLIMRWDDGRGVMSELASIGIASIQGMDAWGKTGIAIGLMGSLPATIYTGQIFDMNTGVLYGADETLLLALFEFIRSGEYAREIRKIDQQLKLTTATLVKINFDVDTWKQVARDKYPSGLPSPHSSDPTQWLFHGHPAEAARGMPLHVALARLCGYRWPAEHDSQMLLSDDARNLIAKTKALPSVDPDGLLTIPAAGGDRPLVDRLRDFLAACFGATWNEALEQRLVAEADELIDKRAAKDGSLEAWLRDRAFRQHCRLFQDRPFLWHIWDGQKDGFSAFLHYHRLNRATLQKLTYTVLGDWIARRNAEGDERRVEAASILQSKLAAILEGEAPYDIFVRWKPLERQPLGWDPDLDDGVRLNIRPWVEAGVLRETPKIKWGVDRGTDPASAPWYELFQGKRNNDHHTTLAEKRAARAAKSATAA